MQDQEKHFGDILTYDWSMRWRHGDEAKRVSPIMEYGGAFGEVFIKHVLESAIKKGGPLGEIKIVII